MTPADISRLMQQAVGHHQSGRLAQAEQMYRQVLAIQPRNPDALHLLGALAIQCGKHAVAIPFITQALRLRPDADFHVNLGIAYKSLGRMNEALGSFDAAVKLAPKSPDAHSGRGTALRALGHDEEAIASFRKAIAIRPAFADAWNNLAAALTATRPEEAIDAARRALQINPNSAESMVNLGVAQQALGKHEEALEQFQRAAQLKPAMPELHYNLGTCLFALGRFDNAAAAFRKAIELKADYAEAYAKLAGVLRSEWKLEDSVAAFRRSLELKPNDADAHCELGNALHRQGLVTEAIKEFRTALKIDPDLQVAHGSLLFSVHYDPCQSSEGILKDHKAWNDQRAAPLAQYIAPHTNDRSPDRVLRIGYVSPDFRQHAVSYFIEPILAHHYRGKFEVFCYSNAPIVDAVTQRLQSYGHQWRTIHKVRDETAAEMIRNDRIDILVDLAVHTFGNRLLLLARKPAPIQVTYLGYAGTSGLSTMDYRLTDPHVDPPGTSEAFHVEKLMRLPETQWCYRPPEPRLKPSPSPFFSNGYITFGSANILAKITPAMMATWAQILHRVPGSRLALKAASFGDDSVRKRIGDVFLSHGIASDRITFFGRSDMEYYLQFLASLDIVLDTHPFNGGTTTCHALWMGIPPIVLSGNTSVSRVGASILINIGLADLIATTPEEYVELAVGLAQDTDRLRSLRTTMRDRMQASPLMNAPRFTGHLEAAYRQMWHAWIA